jgi:hypothetical protein
MRLISEKNVFTYMVGNMQCMKTNFRAYIKRKSTLLTILFDMHDCHDLFFCNQYFGIPFASRFFSRLEIGEAELLKQSGPLGAKIQTKDCSTTLVTVYMNSAM